MALDLILQPFANQGDKQTVPQTDPNSFVSYNTGYTQDYEISLAAGNPQAKAVERPVQNYLFEQASTHQMLWEQSALPPWFSTMPGGYGINAIVIRQQANGDWWPYRSLVDANIGDPLTSANWEYQPTFSKILACVPMPAGAGNPANEIISVATDFNTLTGPGTWEFVSAAIASSSPNTPSGFAGMLESKTWTNSASQSLTTQRYFDSNSTLWVRVYNGTSWTGWLALTNTANVRNDVANWATATNSGNAYTLSIAPGIGTRTEGLRIRFKVPATNTGAVTINDGNGAVALVGLGLAGLTGNELLLNGNAEIRWNSNAVTGGTWILWGCDGGAAQLPTGSYGTTPPAGDSSTKFATTAFVQSVLGGIGAIGEGLVISATGTNANIAIAYGSIMLSNGSGATLPDFNFAGTLVTTATGVNGLDTGTLAASSWYYIFRIANLSTGTKALLFSLSPTAPSLPTGYSFAKIIGAFFTDPTANKFPLCFRQKGRRARYGLTSGGNIIAARIMAQGATGAVVTPASWTAINVADYVPFPITSEISISISQNIASGSVIIVAPNNLSGGYESTVNPPPVNSGTGSSGNSSAITDIMLESANIYYAANNASNGVFCVGYNTNI